MASAHLCYLYFPAFEDSITPSRSNGHSAPTHHLFQVPPPPHLSSSSPSLSFHLSPPLLQLRLTFPMADCTVQHVSKAASDKLLSKFAEMGSGQEEQGKGGGGGRRRRMVTRRESWARGGGQLVVEKRSLLPVSNRRPGLLRQVKGRRSEVRMKEFIVSALLLAKIERTWRRTVDGASSMFMERHCNRHVRLISDAV